MKCDSRLSSVLHLLLHMNHSDHPLTSTELAEYLRTNPVVVRRVLGRLRALGLVDSAKGHGGGWSLTCDPRTVTLRDVYAAVGAPPLFAIGHRTDHPACPVEKAVNRVMDDAFRAAETLLFDRLGRLSLADLSAEFSARRAQHHARKHAHAQ